MEQLNRNLKVFLRKSIQILMEKDNVKQQLSKQLENEITSSNKLSTRTT